MAKKWDPVVNRGEAIERLVRFVMRIGDDLLAELGGELHDQIKV